MTEPKLESFRKAVMFAAIHSQKYRHSGYSSKNLADHIVEEIGDQIVDLYELLYERYVDGVGGGTPPLSGTSSKPNGQRKRGAPYR